MTSDYPQQFSTQQLETICKLADDDSDIEYEELMEIVKIARAELDKMQKLCSATKNGTERNGTERNGTERNGTERNG